MWKNAPGSYHKTLVLTVLGGNSILKATLLSIIHNDGEKNGSVPYTNSAVFLFGFH